MNCAREGCACLDGTRDRGKSYARQVWETVWVTLACAGFGWLFAAVRDVHCR